MKPSCETVKTEDPCRDMYGTIKIPACLKRRPKFVSPSWVKATSILSEILISSTCKETNQAFPARNLPITLHVKEYQLEACFNCFNNA